MIRCLEQDDPVVANRAILGHGLRHRLLRAAGQAARCLPVGRRQAFTAAWRLLGAPDRFVGRVAGQWSVVCPGDVGTSLKQFLWPCYEPEVTAVFLGHIGRGDCVFDMGANKGYFSLMACQVVGEFGRVVSYEPLQENIDDLKRTRDLNGHMHWAIREVAVSSSCGRGKFSPIGADQGHSGWGQLDVNGEREVDVTTLDNELDLVGIGRVDLMKIDIEGSELEALQGAQGALEAGRIQRLLIEYHPGMYCESSYKQSVGWMQRLGYRGERIKEDGSARKVAQAAISNGRPKDAMKHVLCPIDCSAKPSKIFHVLWSRAWS